MSQGDAEQDAKSAEVRAKVTVQEVDTVADLRAVAELLSRIWAAPVVAPMPHDIMRSLVHAGGKVHAAFRDGHLVGASVATFGPPAGASSYSLIAGVSPEVEGQGIGLALKLAQRAWALRAGATRMTWTFDPLLRRNARFNITRLGAVVIEYLVNFYGEIPDGVNDPETDRLAVTWDLGKPLPGSARSSGSAHGTASDGQDKPPAILMPGDHGEPVLAPGPAAAATPSGERTLGNDPGNTTRLRANEGPCGQLRCWIPEDILSARRVNPDLAGRWRMAVREALGGALNDGYEVTGLMEPGWYVLENSRAGR
jgi:predicted GNAT superfamily acetyltransferase